MGNTAGWLLFAISHREASRQDPLPLGVYGLKRGQNLAGVGGEEQDALKKV